MKIIKRMVEETVYETNYGEIFYNEDDCLCAESKHWLEEMSKRGVLLNYDENTATFFEEIYYIIGITDDELEQLNKFYDIYGLSGVECNKDKNGNYYWEGQRFRPFSDLTNLFSVNGESLNEIS